MSRTRPVTKMKLQNVLSKIMYWPSYQKKTVKRSVQCHVFAQSPKEELKRSVQQCHIFAQLPKEDSKTFCPMSRIRPVTKRRL